MGAVLRMYASYPQSCQLAISEFLEISVNENIGAVNILQMLDKYGAKIPLVSTAMASGGVGSGGTTPTNITNGSITTPTSEDMTIPEMKASVNVRAPPTMIHNWLLCGVQICDGSRRTGDKPQMYYMVKHCLLRTSADKLRA
jgi:hypothetical protein